MLVNLKDKIKTCSLFISSLCIVALGQPSKLAVFCLPASLFAYALFWTITRKKQKKEVLFLSFFWFFCIQLVWNSWLFSTKYQGPFMFLIYIFVCGLCALQFAFFSLIFSREKLTKAKLFMMSSLWVLMEMSRIFLLTGYLWNPCGLSLSYNPLSIQWASFGGVYLLSFWVILTNLFFFHFIETKKNFYSFICIAVIPYVFGFFHERIQKPTTETKYSALLLQTGLYPEEKNNLAQFPGKFLYPIEQWEKIFSVIAKKKHKPLDLVVLPEAALPFNAFFRYLPFEDFLFLWNNYFDLNIFLYKFLIPPYAHFEKGQWFISNAFINQVLSHYFQCDIICGLDHKEKGKSYNSAFCFTSNQMKTRYDKQILVPIGEYIPFSFLNSIASQYGIFNSFHPGLGEDIFLGKIPMAVSICLEEIYPEILRKGRNKGAKLLVNITNDAWFPSSYLPKQHFEHGILRAVENGAYLLRACNTGVTGVINPFGKIIKTLPEKERAKGLYVTLPLYEHKTFFMFWGDSFMLGLSMVLCVLFVRKKVEKQAFVLA